MREVTRYIKMMILIGSVQFPIEIWYRVGNNGVVSKEDEFIRFNNIDTLDDWGKNIQIHNSSLTKFIVIKGIKQIKLTEKQRSLYNKKIKKSAFAMGTDDMPIIEEDNSRYFIPGASLNDPIPCLLKILR